MLFSTLLVSIMTLSFCPDFQTQEQQRSTEQRQISLKTTPAADRGRYDTQPLKLLIVYKLTLHATWICRSEHIILFLGMLFSRVTLTCSSFPYIKRTLESLLIP